MDYNTNFKGELKFIQELTMDQFKKIKSIIGEDCRNHPEWETNIDLTYINLEFLDDYSGLVWDGSEKSYDMIIKINLLIYLMKKDYPVNFGLVGEFLCQGEGILDRYKIIINESGLAEYVDIKDDIKQEDYLLINDFYNSITYTVLKDDIKDFMFDRIIVCYSIYAFKNKKYHRIKFTAHHNSIEIQSIVNEFFEK